MSSISIKEVVKIYETPLKNGKSGFELWEEGKNLGSFCTPSTFDSTYLEQITALIHNIIKKMNGKKLMSLGCGNAFIEKQLADKGYDVLATDVSRQALGFAKNKGLKTQFLDARKKFSLKKKFDMIISDGVIGHLVDEELSIEYLLQNCKSVLEKNGVVLISNDSSLETKMPVQPHEKIPGFYWVTAKYLKDSLKKAGYESIHVKYITYFRPEYGLRKRIIVWGRVPS